jgi:hypothetical protein
MENEAEKTDAGEDVEAWTTAPESGTPWPATKLDWMRGLPFQSERGTEVLPPETVKFYRDLS